MPTVNRSGQRTTQVLTSVLSEARPVSQVVDDWIKMVIYGENRVGKTTLACKFPKPLLLIALEPNRTGGALSVKKVPGVDYLRVTSSSKAVRLAEELASDQKFKTVVLDSATSYQDIILTEILGLEKTPEMLEWGTASMDQYRERSEKTREALRPFLNLNKHVIVTAKQRDHNRQDKTKPKLIAGVEIESFFAADLGGATAGWLHDACDYICRLYIDKEIVEKEVKGIGGKMIKRQEETGRLVRRLQTMYHPNYAGGFRSATPEHVPEFIQDPTFEKIYAVIRGEKLPSPSK